MLQYKGRIKKTEYIYSTIISFKQKEISKSMKQAAFFLHKEPHPREE